MMIMKKITKSILALPLCLSLSLGMSTPSIHYAYAKAPKKTVKVGQVSKIKKDVVRFDKKQAKITLSWRKAKNAKAYEISLKMIKKTKVKKGKKIKIKKKIVYKKLANTKKLSYTLKKPYSKTYVFGITAMNKAKKGKRKTITVKVLSYALTKDASASSKPQDQGQSDQTQGQQNGQTEQT